MMLIVNGATIPADAIAREISLHADAPDPEAAARRTLAIRELMLQRAGELGLLENNLPRECVTFAGRDDEDEVIAQVLEAEVQTPHPSADECRRYYDTHPERFRSGDLVEARHILFAILPGTPVMALREHAERVLAGIRGTPKEFSARARELSNCPSGQQDGNLGQFGRGESAPEFDKAIFGTRATGVLPTLVATRYGFHIVAVERRIPGKRLPFEVVADRVAEYLAVRALVQRSLSAAAAVLRYPASTSAPRQCRRRKSRPRRFSPTCRCSRNSPPVSSTGSRPAPPSCTSRAARSCSTGATRARVSIS